MRHPPTMQYPLNPLPALRAVIATTAFVAAFGIASSGAAMASTEHSSRGSASPTPSVPHAQAPRTLAKDRSGPTSSVTTSTVQRHTDRDDVLVFGDPFWDPLWDIDADLVLGYNPWAYPPRVWETYGPTGPARHGLVPIELHVHPWKASVTVDESELGEARDYNDDSHPLFLAPGDHEVELQYPGYETLRFTLNVQKGLPRDLHYTLIKGEGMDPRSAEARPPAPAERSRG